MRLVSVLAAGVGGTEEMRRKQPQTPKSHQDYSWTNVMFCHSHFVMQDKQGEIHLLHGNNENAASHLS